MESIAGKSNGNFLKEIASDFLSLFFPNYCLGCSRALVKGEDILCTFCIHDLPKTNHDFDGENPVKLRFEGRIPVARAMAYLQFRKTGIAQKLLHQLKYNQHPEVGVKIGALIGREIQSAAHSIDLIIPVPLHAARLRQRGYNQSAMLAQGISETTGIPWEESISIRKSNTKTQTRMNRAQRWENVKSVFGVSDQQKIEGKNILLVDDVITTGATLEACGQHLLEANCKSLSIVCIAEAQ